MPLDFNGSNIEEFTNKIVAIRDGAYLSDEFGLLINYILKEPVVKIEKDENGNVYVIGRPLIVVGAGHPDMVNQGLKIVEEKMMGHVFVKLIHPMPELEYRVARFAILIPLLRSELENSPVTIHIDILKEVIKE